LDGRHDESRAMQRDLVVRAQGGDVDAFSALTGRLTNRLYAAARLILRHDELAADAVQDALLQAWLDLRGLRDPDRFDAWLHRLLVRACYRAAKQRRDREIGELKLASTGEPMTPDVQRSVAVRDQLDRGFRRLSPEQRAVIVLHHYLGLSLVESSEILGIPLGTMQSRLSRAAQAMRAALEADDRPALVAREGAR
jgi:RNA polymerase sigma-70 factor (ECF subfamily)